MAEITAAMVKELREKTGAGMMDCKKALAETGGAMEDAITFLREKGLAAAAKKAGRLAAEGLVRTFIEGGTAALVELNCETDFVARNEDFQTFAQQLAEQVCKQNPKDVDALLASKSMHDSGKTVQELVNGKISTIGENISVRRFSRLDSGEVYGEYLHGGGSIGVLVELKLGDAGKASDEALQGLARDLAMHGASENPISVRREEVPQATIDTERGIFKQQALESGKPENIVDKIVDGRINKFFAESVFLEQPFVKDPDVTVKKLLEQVGKDAGTTVELKSFARFKVGEGIEKRAADNLADEVAKMTGGASA
jgi:elongation factor Ts